ncbi:MAG: hypothetical protein EBU90_11580 [Proteobacteria bacterium]|nr:hypothetical protein [Pseudomonadota bacterium]NBP14766.1 hypothetical protein [bacterium]
MKKKYKSLQDIYLEKSFLKKVPSVPGASIFENAQILIQKDPPHGEVEGPFDLSDVKFRKISKIVKQSEEGEKTLSEEIIKISNLPKEAVADILNKISDLSEEDQTKIVEYIKNRSITLEALNNQNVFDIFAKQGIVKEFTQFLYKYELRSAGARVGKGEAFFSLMLKGARKASGVKTKADPDTGDVRIDGQEVEIKGQGARLKGQKGFGAPENVAVFWSEELKKASSNIPEILQKVPAANSLDWNLKEGGYALDTLGQMLIKSTNGSFTLDDLKNLWKKGFSFLYPAAEKTKFNFIDEAYKTGVLNKDVFVKEFIKFATLYYFDVQNINFIVLSKFDVRSKEITKKGAVSPVAEKRYGLLRIITRDDINSGSLFSKVIFKLPQIGGSPGPQGSGLGVSVM